MNEYPFLPIYELRLLPDTSVHLLRRMLKNRCWGEARELYFTNYQATIPDWIVYIDDKGNVTQDLSTNPPALTRLMRWLHFERGPDRVSTTHRAVSGKRFVYALVVSDSDLTASEDPPPVKSPPLDARLSVRVTGKDFLFDAPLTPTVGASTPPAGGGGGEGASQLEFRRRVVAFQRDPILSVLITGLGKALGVASSPEAPLLDSSQMISLTQIAARKSDPLYVALGRWSLIENARFEFSLKPAPGKVFAPRQIRPMILAGRPFVVRENTRLTDVYMNLANDREHSFEAGLVAGVTRGRPIRTFAGTPPQISGESPKSSGNVYVAATANLVWFTEPISTYLLRHREAWRRSSFGPIVGTNVLRGSIGDELIVGFALGHILGDAGLTIAADWQAEPEIKKGRVVNPHKARWLWGFYLPY